MQSEPTKSIGPGTMTDQTLQSHIKSLEIQLAVLKARSRPGAASKSPDEVYGLLAGQGESTEKDLEAVEYRLTWDRSPNDAQ